MAAPATTSTAALASESSATISHAADGANLNSGADAVCLDSYERSPAPPREPPEYLVGEKALCYHGPLIYEAKILQSAHFDSPAPLTKMTGWHYFVHYKGWKRTWDEWVDQTRLLKLNEANLAFQKNLMQPVSLAMGSAKAANGSGTAMTSTGGAGGNKAGGAAGAAASAKVAPGKKDPRGTKRGRDEDDPTRKAEMKLVLPEILKQVLVNDWENVTRHSRLVEVPASPTVVDILSSFSKYVTAMDPKPSHLKEPEKQLDAVVSGLQTYFDKSLGVNLLYRFERPQYAEIRKRFSSADSTNIDSLEMSSVYGAEHLLRMLVSLPAMVAQSSLDKGSVETIRDYANELILYMVQERHQIFQSEYQPTGPMYSNVARS